ncbi:MAG: hypothetical protein WBN60_14495, partial [Polyangiales bacterium]
MSDTRPLGVWTGVLCALGVVQTVAVLVFAATSTQWFQATLSDDVLWVRLAIAWATVQITLLLLSIAIAQRATKLARGARGRARALGLGITAVLHALITSATIGI